MKYIYYVERNVFLSCDFRENNQYFNKHENAVAEIFINKKYFSGIKGNFIPSGCNVFPEKNIHILVVYLKKVSIIRFRICVFQNIAMKKHNYINKKSTAFISCTNKR